MEQVNDALASLQARLGRLGKGLMPLHVNLMQAFISEAQQFAGTASTLAVQMTADLGAAETRIFELGEANNALRDEYDLALRASEREHAEELSQVETKLDDTVARLRTAESRARALEDSYQTLQDNGSREIAALKARLADAGRINEGLAAQQEAARLQILGLERDLSTAVKSSEQYEEEVNDATVELLGVTVDHEEARRELDQINRSLAAVTLDYSSAQRAIDDAKEKEARLQTQFGEATDGMAAAQKERDEFRSQCQAVKSELDAVKADWSSSQQRLTDALERVAAANQERDEFQKQCQAVVVELDAAKAERLSSQQQLEQATEGMAVAQKERDEFWNQCQAANVELDAVKEERSSAQRRLDESKIALALAETSRSRFEQQAQESETKLATIVEQLKNAQDGLTTVTAERLALSRQSTMDAAKHADLQRDVVRQRDEAVRQRDDATAARDDLERQLADAGATNVELQDKLDQSEEQLAQRTSDVELLRTQVVNVNRHLSTYGPESRFRRPRPLKRKREEETVVDSFWLSQAEQVYDAFSSIRPDPQFEVDLPVLLHAARRVASVLGSRDGKNEEQVRLEDFCEKATQDVWFCFEAVTNVGWEAAGGVPESCPQHDTSSCFQIKNTGNGVGFRLAQDIS